MNIRLMNLRCLNAFNQGGGLDISKYLGRQREVSLFEMALLKEAGLINNANTPIMSAKANMIKPVVKRHPRTLLYEVWDGDSRRPAKPHDSQWWKMYVEHLKRDVFENQDGRGVQVSGMQTSLGKSNLLAVPM